jgi:hypothetical protein
VVIPLNNRSRAQAKAKLKDPYVSPRMKVKDLIAELQKQDPDSDVVFIGHGDHQWYYIRGVTDYEIGTIIRHGDYIPEDERHPENY